MKTPYINVTGIAKRDTELAFCVRNAEYGLDGEAVHHHTDMWIPLANMTEDSRHTVEEAVEGDEVEIFVAKWWLKEQ